MITLGQARDAVGRKVVYERPFCSKEVGVITSVNDTYVFVRYGTNQTSHATSPEDLTLEWQAPR